MKHRLLTTLVGTILCLGWGMSANAQNEFYMQTIVDGETKYLGFDNGKFKIDDTPTILWTFTQETSSSSAVKGSYTITYKPSGSSTTYYIKYIQNPGGSITNGAYAFAPTSGTSSNNDHFYLFQKGETSNKVDLEDGIDNKSTYYIGRYKYSSSSHTLNMLSNVLAPSQGASSGPVDRIKVTKGCLEFTHTNSKDYLITTGNIKFNYNGEETKPNSVSKTFVSEMAEFTLIAPATFYGTFNVNYGTNMSGMGSITIKEGTTTKESPVSITETTLSTETKVSKTYSLKATANEDYDFLGWSTDATENGIFNRNTEMDYTVDVKSMSSNAKTVVTIYAIFAQHKDYFLNGEGIKLNTSSLTIKDGVDNSKIESFSVGQDVSLNSIVYKRQITNAAWQPWFTPFEFTLTQGLLDNYRFAKIAGAFADVDTDIKYISFVAINNVGETIKANVPYIVYAKKGTGTSAPYEFNLGSGTMKATTTNNELTIQSAEQKFTFKGIYATKTSDATDDTPATWYTLNKNGEFKRPGKDVTINGFRFTMEVTDLENNPYFVEGEAEIRVRVFSDMPCEWIDDPTWVVTPKAKAEASSEAYDLTGRKMSKEGMNRRGQIFIKNGKKYWNR